MYVLLTNRPMTRRKTLNHVLDNTGEVVWSGANVGMALEYLVEKGETSFRLQDQNPELQFLVTVKRALGAEFDTKFI